MSLSLIHILPVFDEYEFILLPGVDMLPDRVIDALKKTSASVIASGMTLESDEEALRDLFFLRLREKVEDVRGTYMRTVPKTVFSDFREKQWVFLDKSYWICLLYTSSLFLHNFILQSDLISGISWFVRVVNLRGRRRICENEQKGGGNPRIVL